MYIDLHTHYPCRTAGVIEIVNRYFDQPPTGAALESVGLHPWYLEADRMEEAIAWLAQQAEAPNCVAIGESGLDRLTRTPMNLQNIAFEASVKTAAAVGKPLIIHCVRAQEDIIAAHKRLRPQGAWVIHGFNKKPAVADLLLKADIYLSFGAAIMPSGSPAAVALKQTPDHRFFLETDDQSAITIEAIYEKAAAIRGVSVALLKTQMEANSRAAGFLRHRTL
jgi:TatD DNase family protein